MKKLQLSLLFSLAFFIASSQKVYFLYVQADPEQAFFVKMNEKIHSSTASGYIILSKLVDSTYSFSIGFPQNKWPEQYFSVAVNKKDHGYLLKNFGEKGWGLFDLQTLAVQMGTTGKTAMTEKPEINNDVSVFTDILAKAADDPSLKERPVQPKPEEKKTEVAVQEVPKAEVKQPVIEKPVETAVVAVLIKEEIKPAIKEAVAVIPAVVTEQPVVKKEEPKTDTRETVDAKPAALTEQPVVKKEEAKETVATKPVELTEQPVVKKDLPTGTEEAKPAIKEAVIAKPAETIEQPVKKEEVTASSTQVEIVPEEPYKASLVKKWSENSTVEGVGIVFIDSYENGVRDTVRVLIPNPLPAVTATKDLPAATGEPKKEEPKEEKKFIETISVENNNKPAETIAAAPKFLSAPPIGSAANANNCKEVAAEDDFFKLRKSMASGRQDEEMLSSAKKYFKTKCFTSLQVKNLAALFLSDEGKYKFFDLAYGHVSDVYNFPLLVAELRDEYYVNRFRAMLRN
ncbi:MAG: DUF4476 domain-containing protein [Chitinophagaceae bacterium]